MKHIIWIFAGLVLVANGSVLLMYQGVVRGSYLFVTAGTVLLPMALSDFIVGLICFACFIRSFTSKGTVN
jgi:hypothetical protein